MKRRKLTAALLGAAMAAGLPYAAVPVLAAGGTWMKSTDLCWYRNDNGS